MSFQQKVYHHLHLFLQQLECTSCQETYDWMSMAPDYHETSEKKYEKGWNLYIKEFETYRAFVLWNPTLQKDWSQVYPQKDSVTLFDQNENRILTLESVGIQNDFVNWVPSEKDQSMYERILENPKEFQSSIHAYLVGSYLIPIS